MTLAAPRSRQGKFFLVLAILAAVAAVSGALLWSSRAQADIPATTVTVDDNAGSNVPAGGLITYTIGVDVTGTASGTTTNTVLSIDFDDDLVNGTVTGASGPWAVGECSIGAGNVLTCTDATGPLVDATVTVTFQAAGTTISPPSACSVQDDGAGTATCTINPTDVTVDAGVTVEDATNPPGTPHTFVFELAAGWTCQSDDNNDTNDVECDSSDVTLGGSVTCTATDPVVDEDGAAGDSPVGPATVSITITPATGDEGDCTVTLAVFFTGDQTGNDDETTTDCCDTDVTATKTYSLETLEGEVRHLDEPDAGTEDAADTDDSDPLEDWCDGSTFTPPDTCGIITPQDDLDDATGSFHQACIINGDLTHAGASGFITWNIVPVSGSPLPTPVSVTELAGPFDEPCVRWSTGFTGTQNITAVYDNGVGPAVTYYYDAWCVEAGDCTAIDDTDIADDTTAVPLPLVKEWNDIDETRIVAADGDIGDDPADELNGNTGDFAAWSARDCALLPETPGVGNVGFCDDANWDGLTMDVESAFIINSPQGLLISAGGTGFIDYVFGSHADAGGAYTGPVDGAEQTYTISGDCGSVRLENPTTGEVIILSNSGQSSATVLSSDKGVGFEFLPNTDGSLTTTLANADCGPLAEICVTISTIEDNLFRSPPLDDAEDEEVCIRYVVGPVASKTPILAWAGQRVVLEHYWGGDDGTCVELDAPNGDPDEFGVMYTKQAGPGGFTAALQGSANDMDITGSDAIVDVELDADDDNQDGITDPNSNCTSRIVYESEDQGQVDISAFVVDDNDNLANADPRTAQVAFVIYYMKFEDVTLGIVPELSGTHSPGTGTASAIEDSTDDVTDFTSNVSANVLARVRVRGWVLTDNCPARDSRVGTNGDFIPANRCIFPDDWRFKAGGNISESVGLNGASPTAGIPEETRPSFDTNKRPSASYLSNTAGCQTEGAGAAGPFSLLDRLVGSIANGVALPANLCDDSLAPHEPADGGSSVNCLTGGLTYNCRETVFPDGIISAWDANMPPALIRFLLTGSGYLWGADKDQVYGSNSNPFYVTHIPAEPWLSPINFDLSGYQWNSWGGAGARSGVYDFWNDLADFGPEVVSCARNSSGANVTQADPCPNEAGVGVPTGGYNMTKVYSDNHGEAFTWINGDANLDFGECATSAAAAGNNIVLLNGFYCEEGDLVGSSTLSALADYPDKRKHFAVDSNDVTIDWTWGGTKVVTIEPGEGPQFNYVVLHVTDRDGYCDGSGNTPPSLHPVLGEQVNFTIDSPAGIIVPDINGNAAAGPPATVAADGKSAVTHTFDTDVNQSIANGGITVLPLQTNDPDGECQAWIHVSESLLGSVNVIVTAFDPEGTVTFDVIINPTPTPSPTPSPTAPPPTQIPTQDNLWADIDCDDDVDPVDSLKALIADAGQTPDQEASCPEADEVLSQVFQDGDEFEDLHWGDADCDEDVDPVDSLKILRFDAGLDSLQQEPCPDIGSEVAIPVQ